jgi:DNA topoisomerase-1
MSPKKSGVSLKKSEEEDIFVSPSAKTLIIVESPSKCKKIEEYLGPEYKCIASKGHIRTLDGGLKAIKTKNDFTASYDIVDESRIQSMKRVITKFSKSAIILATDDDREGEAIAWHICVVFELPIETTRRILFHEITKPAIIAAVENPTYIRMNIVYSQQARQILDVLVGYKISPLLWKYIYHSKEKALSAGRCQTPALRLVYENAEKGKTVELEMRYKTTGVFFEKQIPFFLNHSFSDSKEMEEFLEISKTFEHSFHMGENREIRKSPPKPLNTSQLLQTANNRMSASPKETMSLAQILYQLGYITYMRTDSTKYSNVFLKSTTEYILKEYRKSEYISPTLDKMTASEKDPHEAVRPTNILCISLPTGVKELDANPRLHILYHIIWKITLESCMSDAVYQGYPIHIDGPLKYTYSHLLEIPQFLGWRILEKNGIISEEHADETPKENILIKHRKKAGAKSIKESANTAVQDSASALKFYFSTLASKKAPLKYIDSIVTATRPHTHYTESSLIQRLEDLGIGRPSTFAPIVETIQDRGYVKCRDIEGQEYPCKEYNLSITADGGPKLNVSKINKIFGNEKRKLVIQPIGELAITFLLKNFEILFSYDYTKSMEEQLDAIVESAKPNEKRHEVCKESYDFLKKEIQSLKDIAKIVYPLRISKDSEEISEDYVVCFQIYGPAIRQRNLSKDSSNGEDKCEKWIYHSVKKGISLDMECLIGGEYSIDEILEIKEYPLGKYKEFDLYMKMGKFGPYLEYGETRKSLKSFLEYIQMDSLDGIELERAIDFIENPGKYEPFKENTFLNTKEPTKGIIREINEEMNIRKGKYGAYIFYKRANMKDPQFLKLRGFPLGYSTCPLQVLEDWIYTTYNLPRGIHS